MLSGRQVQGSQERKGTQPGPGRWGHGLGADDARHLRKVRDAVAIPRLGAAFPSAAGCGARPGSGRGRSQPDSGMSAGGGRKSSHGLPARCSMPSERLRGNSVAPGLHAAGNQVVLLK